MLVLLQHYYAGFVVNKVTLGQVFLSEFFSFPCQYHSTMALHSDISPEG
jgi:hypothetical protein